MVIMGKLGNKDKGKKKGSNTEFHTLKFQFLDTEESFCHLTQVFVSFRVQQLQDRGTEVPTLS